MRVATLKKRKKRKKKKGNIYFTITNLKIDSFFQLPIFSQLNNVKQELKHGNSDGRAGDCNPGSARFKSRCFWFLTRPVSKSNLFDITLVISDHGIVPLIGPACRALYYACRAQVKPWFCGYIKLIYYISGKILLYLQNLFFKLFYEP